MSSFIRLEILQGVGKITINNPPVNALCLTARKDLLYALNQCLVDESVQVILVTGEGKLFCAGADITEFSADEKPPTLTQIIRAFELSPKLTVVGMHGYVLGGGLELSLGCHYRCAESTSLIGLPEIKLGIIPGSGGTQRLPRLIGAERALDMILDGEPIEAAQALEWRLVDHLIEQKGTQEALHQGFIDFAKFLLAKGAGMRRTCNQRVMKLTPDVEAAYLQWAISSEKQYGPLAPRFNIECVKQTVDTDFEKGMKLELDRYLQCERSAQSRALQHIFFGEKSSAKADRVSKKAQRSTQQPQRFSLVEPLVSVGILGRDKVPAYFDKAGINITAISHKSDLDVDEFDLILDTRIDSVSGPAVDCLDERVVGWQMLQVNHSLGVAEIVLKQKTSAEVVGNVLSLCKRLGVALVFDDTGSGLTGYRLLQQLLLETNSLLQQGIAPEVIDQSLEVWGLALGPCRWCASQNFDMTRAYTNLCDGMLLRERLQLLSNHFSFSYMETNIGTDIASANRVYSDIANRLIDSVIVKAEEIVREGHISETDIDVISINGLGFPRFRGGLMHYAANREALC